MFNWFKNINKEVVEEATKPKISFEIFYLGDKYLHLEEELKKALEDSGFPSTYSGGGTFNFLGYASNYGFRNFKRYTFNPFAYEANKAFVSDTEIKETDRVKSPTIKLCHSLISEHDSWGYEYSEDGCKRYWHYKNNGRVLINNNTTCDSFNSAEAILIKYFQNKWLTKQAENTRIAERNHLEALFGETK
jgi:hypothetical protein